MLSSRIRSRSLWLSLIAALALIGCDGGEDPPEDAGTTPLPDGGTDGGTDAGPEPPAVPDSYCPGAEGCPDEGDGVLHAGVGAVAITPPITGVEGEEVWLAGFGNGRAATGVHDDAWARAIALRHNQTTVVILVLDVVGYFLDDADAIRERVEDLGVQHIAVSATHTHEAADTIGIWGPTLSDTGRSPEYMRFIEERAEEAIRAAVESLRPAHLQYASLRLRDQPGGMIRYVSDTRDPQVIDDAVRVMRFIEPEGETIGTLVNFAAHPEYLGSRNTLLSSDFPHWLREGVEEGVTDPDGQPVEGVGGTTIFVNGALGSQIGPGQVRLETWEGESIDRYTLEAGETLGTQLAYFVLRALGPEGGSITDETAAVGFRTHRFFVRVENRRYHIAFLQGLFTRNLYNWDEDRRIQPGNIPDVLTEVTVIDVGRVQMMTAPGELDPCLFVGGYDGSYTPEGFMVVDTERENPPDLSMAPPPPYLQDLAREDAEQVWLLGLTNDFLGYFIPPFDYELHPTAPYLAEAPGRHYEETNSVGENAWPRIGRKLTELLAWTPDD